jgi:rfaE bifunctional protein nucleotidyltransferase chain/domain
MKTNLSFIQNKIYDRTALQFAINRWRLKNDKIVFTNGCFDILHLGHIDYLSKAADCGSRLIIGVNTDASVKVLGKGSSRPIQDENSRLKILAALGFVDAVILFDEPTPIELIELIKPDVLVKGADYTIDKVVGADFVIKNGGKVELIDYLQGYSTTSIENIIKQF